MSTLARSACARTGLGLGHGLWLGARLGRRALSTRPSLPSVRAPGPSAALCRRQNSSVRRAPPASSAPSVPPVPPVASASSASPNPVSATATAAATSAAAPLASPAAAAEPTTWVDKFPRAMQPYMRLLRLDKPIGTILLYWPGAWAITLAATELQLAPGVPAWYLFLFGVGAIVMRGAGCVINDMWDARMDRMVGESRRCVPCALLFPRSDRKSVRVGAQLISERTKSRPIAAGEITHTQATAFLASQMALGLGVLSQLNWYSIVLGAASVPLIIVYPLMKRYTYYPQVVLGLCFDWGALLGWAAVAGSLNWAVAGPLYVGSVLWCIGYDTIYAHQVSHARPARGVSAELTDQDKTDDVLAGVKSTALAWGDRTKPIVGTLYAGFISCLALAGHALGAGPIYYAVSCAGTACHLAWQVITVDLDSRADCWAKFKANGFVAGAIVWLGIAGNYLDQVLGWF